MALSSQALCQSQELREISSIAYSLLGDWASKQELNHFMTNAVMREEQGLRVPRRGGGQLGLQGQGSFRGRQKPDEGGRGVGKSEGDSGNQNGTWEGSPRSARAALHSWGRERKAHHLGPICRIEESGPCAKEVPPRKVTPQ